MGRGEGNTNLAQAIPGYSRTSIAIPPFDAQGSGSKTRSDNRRHGLSGRCRFDSTSRKAAFGVLLYCDDEDDEEDDNVR